MSTRDKKIFRIIQDRVPIQEQVEPWTVGISPEGKALFIAQTVCKFMKTPWEETASTVGALTLAFLRDWPDAEFMEPIEEAVLEELEGTDRFDFWPISGLSPADSVPYTVCDFAGMVAAWKYRSDPHEDITYAAIRIIVAVIRFLRTVTTD